MSKSGFSRTIIVLLGTVALALMSAGASRAEILNDDEFGSIELRDFSVIESAADMFTPVGLRFDVSRGGPVYPGNDITIYYRGMHGMYATLLDYSSDPLRKVKPLVMNELTRLNEGGLEREYVGAVGKTLGPEYIMLIITALPLSDARLEEIALAPNEVETGDEILSVAVNNFEVLSSLNLPDRNPDRPISIPIPIRHDMFIDLTDFQSYIDYPLNLYPYNPWPYMYLYPYPRFLPWAYSQSMGPLTQTWYVFPSEKNRLQSNFWDYASDAWIDNGLWIIPPGGSWQGTLRVDDPYTSYYLRILPYLARQNQSYLSLLQVEINGTLVQSNIDLSGAIGYGTYWTNNPFAYYNVNTLLHRGDNTIRLYWPQDQQDNMELQMLDVVPADTAVNEISHAEQAAQSEAGNTGTGESGTGSGEGENPDQQ